MAAEGYWKHGHHRIAPLALDREKERHIRTKYSTEGGTLYGIGTTDRGVFTQSNDIHVYPWTSRKRARASEFRGKCDGFWRCAGHDDRNKRWTEKRDLELVCRRLLGQWRQRHGQRSGDL